MADLTGYISYREAKQILNDRLQTSDDEIALWVSGAAGITLAAYVISFRGFLIPFLANGCNPFGGENYIRPLERLHFLPAEVEQFKPDKRFIPWRELVERWKKYNSGDKARTIDLIDGRREDGLFEYHPVYGAPESLSGEGFERGLFDLEKVEAVESKLIPDVVEPLAGTGVVGKSAIEKEVDRRLAYDRRLESFNKWLSDTGLSIEVLTIEMIFNQVRLTNKSLWGSNLGTFKREFWQKYSKDYGVKKEPGRPLKK